MSRYSLHVAQSINSCSFHHQHHLRARWEVTSRVARPSCGPGDMHRARCWHTALRAGTDQAFGAQVIITGASSGLGLSAARALAESGDWHVVMACRDFSKAQQAAKVLSHPPDRPQRRPSRAGVAV